MKRKLLAIAGTAAMAAALGGVAAAASGPTAVTGRATSVKLNSATLNGTVNPDGTSTTYFFQWGLTTSYGAAGAPCRLVRGQGQGHQPGGDRARAGTLYHYRLVAANRFGTAYGVDRSLQDHRALTARRADRGGVRIGDDQRDADRRRVPGKRVDQLVFQWGTSPSYGENTAAQTFAPSTNAQFAVTPVGGILAPGTKSTTSAWWPATPARRLVWRRPSFMTFPYPRPTPRVLAGTTRTIRGAPRSR